MHAAARSPDTSTADAPAPPRTRVLRRLGEGGMGRVWLAERTVGDGVTQRVVVKRPLAAGDPDADGELARRFDGETRALARVSHGNVVHLLDAGRDEHGPWMLLEHVDGVDAHVLLDALRDGGGGFDADAAAWVAHEAARGMAAAHAVRDASGEPAPILHRDLSPQNVLVSRLGDVKVSDFGVAWAADRASRTTTGVVVGNLRYAAPEQLEGRALSPATDVYGVGRLLEELLAHAADGDARRALREVAARATRRAADERHASMNALADDLLDAAPTLCRGRASLAARVESIVGARDRFHGALAGLLASERDEAPAWPAPTPPPPAPAAPAAPVALAPTPRAMTSRRAAPYAALALTAVIASVFALSRRDATPRDSLPRAPLPATPREALSPEPVAPAVAPSHAAPVVEPVAVAPSHTPTRDEAHRAPPRHDRAPSVEAVAAPVAAAPQPATLRVSTIPFARVSVDDGEPVGTPHAFTLAPGEHRVRARFEVDGGRVEVTRTVTLGGAEVQTLGLTPSS